MSAWQKTLTEVAVNSAVNYVGNQIAERQVVEPNKPDVNPEYEEFLKAKQKEQELENYEVYAQAKLLKYKDENSKSIKESKIAQVAVGGNMILPLVLYATDMFGVTLTGEQQGLALLGINFIVGAVTVYLRKNKTTKLIK